MKEKKQKQINKEILDELEFGMHYTKIIHQGWKEQKTSTYKKIANRIFKDTGFIPSGYFGKWQYIFESQKGRISMIKIKMPVFLTKNKYNWLYEIWFQETLFSDTIRFKRFKTKKEAFKKIREYLC